MNRRTIKPAREGQRIRRPDGQPLAAAGESVIWTSYWQRRLNDGDVALADSHTPPLPLAGGGQGGGRKSAAHAAPKE